MAFSFEKEDCPTKEKSQKKTVTLRRRWNSADECRAYLASHKPTGLTLCAAIDYLEGEAKRAERAKNENIVRVSVSRAKQ